MSKLKQFLIFPLTSLAIFLFLIMPVVSFAIDDVITDENRKTNPDLGKGLIRCGRAHWPEGSTNADRPGAIKLETKVFQLQNELRDKLLETEKTEDRAKITNANKQEIANYTSYIKQDISGSVINPCGFDDLMATINRILNFVLVALALPIIALMFIYAGALYLMSAANSSYRSKAKDIFFYAVIGLVLAFTGFIIIEFLLRTLGYSGSWIGFN